MSYPFSDDSALGMQGKWDCLDKTFLSTLRSRGYSLEQINRTLEGCTLEDIRIYNYDIDLFCSIIESLVGPPIDNHIHASQSSLYQNATQSPLNYESISVPVEDSQRAILDGVISAQNRYHTTSPISITGWYPHKKITKNTEIPEGSDFDRIKDLMSTSMESDNKSLSSNDWLLSRVDDAGWSIEFSHDDVYDERFPITIGVRSLEAGNILLLRTTKDCVGPRALLQDLKKNFIYNPSMKAKVDSLKDKYIGWRPIRGDGNCYYRTVIYGILEQAVLLRKHNVFRTLHNIFNLERGKFNDEMHNSFHEDMLGELKKAAAGTIWQNLDSLQADFLNTSTGGDNKNMDYCLIKACRKVISTYLIENESLDVNGISLRDAILPSYPDVSTMGDYCRNHIDSMGVDAEGPIVDMGTLLTVLNCTGVTVFLDRRENVDIAIRECGVVQTATSKPVCVVHLLLRPGHYDLLYPIDTQFPPTTALPSQSMFVSSLTDRSRASDVTPIAEHKNKEKSKEKNKDKNKNEIDDMGYDNYIKNDSSGERFTVISGTELSSDLSKPITTPPKSTNYETFNSPVQDERASTNRGSSFWCCFVG